MVHQTCCFLGAHNRLVEACSGNASVRMESDNAHLTMRRENTAVTNTAYTTSFLRANRGNVGHPQCVGALDFVLTIDQVRARIRPLRCASGFCLCQTHRPRASAERFVHDRYRCWHGEEHATLSAHRRYRNYLYAQHSCVQPHSIAKTTST